MRPTRVELANTTQLHKMWLNGEAGGVQADLSDTNLSDLDLSGVDLRRAFLLDTKLCGTNLRKAKLNEAYLAGADLNEADLSKADLRGVYFNGANLSSANFSRALLSNATLNGVSFDHTDFSGAGCCAAQLGCHAVVVTTTHIHVGYVQRAIHELPPDHDTNAWEILQPGFGTWWPIYNPVVHSMIATAKADVADRDEG